MTLTEMEQALEQAKAELRRADMIANTLAGMLVGRLRNSVSPYWLSNLKRELRDWNIHTSTWISK